MDGTELLIYHNLTGQPLDRFPFHLYLNAFQPTATWVREAKAMGSRDTSYEEWEEKDEVRRTSRASKSWAGRLDLEAGVHPPDDNNKDDRTVVI